MVVADAVIRKLPGALGHAESALEESFSRRSAARPSTRTTRARPSYRGWDVPEILLSGDHARVREWRLAAQPRGRGRASLGRSEFSTI